MNHYFHSKIVSGFGFRSENQEERAVVKEVDSDLENVFSYRQKDVLPGPKLFGRSFLYPFGSHKLIMIYRVGKEVQHRCFGKLC